jgi:hypothetical protein
MSNTPRFSARTLLGLTLAILQAMPVYAGTIAFTRDGLNARSSNLFRGTGNVLTTVPRGTEGDVVERWELPSGNYSVKLKITKLGAGGTSLKLDEEIWVYYHKDAARRLVQAYDDAGKIVADLKDQDAKWAVALSSFRVQKSEPKEETPELKLAKIVCTTCNIAPVIPPVVAPIQIKDITTAITVIKNDQETVNDKVKTIPVIDPSVEEIVQFIANDQKANLSRRQLKSADEESNRLIAQTIVDECKSQNVPVDLVLGMISQESHFFAKSHSRAGARGLMQIMPITYRDGTKKKNYNTLYDPKVNIHLGIQEIAGYLKKYDGDVTKSLQAYNWGAGALDAYLNGSCSSKRQDKSGNCVMPKETQDYVGAVTKYRDDYVAYAGKTKTNLLAQNDTRGDT